MPLFGPPAHRVLQHVHTIQCGALAQPHKLLEKQHHAAPNGAPNGGGGVSLLAVAWPAHGLTASHVVLSMHPTFQALGPDVPVSSHHTCEGRATCHRADDKPMARAWASLGCCSFFDSLGAACSCESCWSERNACKRPHVPATPDWLPLAASTLHASLHTWRAYEVHMPSKALCGVSVGISLLTCIHLWQAGMACCVAQHNWHDVLLFSWSFATLLLLQTQGLVPPIVSCRYAECIPIWAACMVLS
jgi:hypothetical protein